MQNKIMLNRCRWCGHATLSAFRVTCSTKCASKLNQMLGNLPIDMRASLAGPLPARDAPMVERPRKRKVYGSPDRLPERVKTAAKAIYEGEACAICLRKPEVRNLAIDHCHATGRIRGLLCTHCNTGLGMFKDREDLLLRAIEYLRNPPAFEPAPKRLRLRRIAESTLEE